MDTVKNMKREYILFDFNNNYIIIDQIKKNIKTKKNQ
jgi:hypothetical protein